MLAGLGALLWLILLAGCGGGLRHFPLEEIVWVDEDQRPFAEPPASFYSSYSWDGADNSVFRPLSDLLIFERSQRAINVNALDEVPDSSWYVNRLSREAWSPERVARGPCADLNDDLPGPWTIVGGKPDGANPGFQIEDATGQRYLMKTDGDLQAERPGAADVIGSLIFYAAGYYAPCNRVVVFDRDNLVLGEGVEIERTNGTSEPLTNELVSEVLEKATRLPDGRYRASVSQFVEGRPISPWRYWGMRQDDPNDAVPHEHRRDLRGMYVLSAWTDHIDARQENTMAAWMTVDEASGVGYVRHYVIDFGDCFGIIHAWDDLVKRFGHSGYLDLGDVVGDWLTLGMVDRPWFHAEYGEAGSTLGYYDLHRFVADRWTPGYANNAYDRLQEADAAWMTRIVARFKDEHVRAMVARGRFTNPTVSSELSRIINGRRDRILDRWLTRLSPLTWPEVRVVDDGAVVCMQDLATWTGIREEGSRRYETAAYVGTDLAPVPIGDAVRDDESWVCAKLPEVPGASASSPKYLVVDLRGTTADDETGPARAHLYAMGGTEYRLVGLERPGSTEAPTR
ncbi:MAG: hypothetical protein DRJ42_03835 [Deltaproteobacteria bacterium]|nr:MAG: hypothetical protein DRJ42_03835 [Deltaproteobacteria bacterium]